MMVAWKRTLLSGLGLWAIFFAPAVACECARSLALGSRLAQSERVFAGTVVSLDQKFLPVGREAQVIRQTVSFRVDKAWKGVKPGQIVTISADVGSGTCDELVTAPSPRTENFVTFVPMPPPPPRLGAPSPPNEQTPVLDYNRWVIFDEASFCVPSHPLVKSEPTGKSAFEQQLDRLVRKRRRLAIR
jgi:hypothetical protein